MDRKWFIICKSVYNLMEKQHIYRNLCLSNSSQQPSLLALGQWSLCVQVCFRSKRSMTALLWPNRMREQAGRSALCLNYFRSCGCLRCCKWQSTHSWGASFLLRGDLEKNHNRREIWASLRNQRQGFHELGQDQDFSPCSGMDRCMLAFTVMRLLRLRNVFGFDC